MRLIKNISCITALLILITFISGCLGNSIMKSEDQIHIEVIVKIESPHSGRWLKWVLLLLEGNLE